ncbi:MAG: hypothetical protein DWH91_08175 [Planctomycetota bacterium]|nr:MAG: hypothetical protein DWH91_08175 [Planctomycetota bacterium]
MELIASTNTASGIDDLMSSRTDTLQKIRSLHLTSEPLPELSSGGVRYPDPLARFCEVLAMVGGRGIPVASRAEAQAVLQTLPQYQSARKRISVCAGVGDTNFPAEKVTDPHALEDVDFAILPGEVAVAENAAVWVTDQHVPHRVLFFLTQHLALVVPRSRLVHNLGQAYPLIDVQTRPFTAWISGPSKTADIEQSLVIGAHGPRSLTVFLLDE